MDHEFQVAYFSGCKFPVDMPEEAAVFKHLMAHLGVELIPVPFYCCGNPARGEHFEASMFSAIKNLAIAEQKSLDILTPCKCCFGQLKHAMYWYETLPELGQRIDLLLAQENLSWNASISVFHTINFLSEKIGFGALAQKIINPLKEAKMVVQHGCHAIRPNAVTHFEQPGRSGMFETLLKMAGVDVLEWTQSRVCCGNPIQETSPDLAADIMQQKRTLASQAGADTICTACTHCAIQYKTTESLSRIKPHNIKADGLAAVLAKAMGIESGR